MTPQQMIEDYKNVITSLKHFMSTTTVVNGFNQGQLDEGSTEIDRLCKRIIMKAEEIGGSYLAEQKLYVSQIMKEIKA